MALEKTCPFGSTGIDLKYHRISKVEYHSNGLIQFDLESYVDKASRVAGNSSVHTMRRDIHAVESTSTSEMVNDEEVVTTVEKRWADDWSPKASTDFIALAYAALKTSADWKDAVEV